ncbi:hypothetical protein EDC44_10920 [Cricetibacter osteomyelitidis]|uniref:Uncharacterized protein n=1 Tax=Cricetibacter osteomyelitidis TaxID=1521931 RepID=A0A4R2SXT3_9PAST|nr:hypothetical protein [Cricetibacter osteomyelitidis]TCP95329.1 hypothetical protein EDC44_10920 [Cricetibacter osteomyelitidis]
MANSTLFTQLPYQVELLNQAGEIVRVEHFRTHNNVCEFLKDLRENHSGKYYRANVSNPNGLGGDDD